MRCIVISPDIREKLLNKHQVTELEVHQCFDNLYTPCVEDLNEEHHTDPPTHFFLAETDKERLLKVIFVLRDGNLHIKSAYDANQAAIDDYRQACDKQ